MDTFIKLFKKYFLWLFFSILFIQMIAVFINLFSFHFINPENFKGTLQNINLIRSELSFWLFNALFGLIIFLDMKKHKSQNIGLIILTLLNGTVGVTLFLFQAYYELTKANGHE